ncbi:MarR family winged helix-turn-helix transcriptional regulator [Demequina soli]|uniref:MarR family winged helix-turn-helix transcriptional regulator n=1 Tax=Demequina soli TaxID=1638987 RepID=UPI000781D756|nr:MarR family winged helix-turn-helix transcriptional regulator [Demequina soli]
MPDAREDATTLGADVRALLGAERYDVARSLADAERVRRVVEQRMTLASAELRLLWLLSDGAARTMRDVSDDLGLEQSTVNRQVAAALKHGLIRRYRPDSGGALVLEVTPAGAEALRRDITLSMDVIRGGLDRLEAGERAVFAVLLGRFMAGYDEAAAALPAAPATS